MTIGDADKGSARASDAQGRLSVEIRQTDGAVVCALAGELDLDSLGPARAALDDAIAGGPAMLVVDLAGLQFCDSSGLNLLLQTRLAAQAADLPLALVSLAPQVARVFEITGAETVFAIHDSVDAAVATR
ncbi:STAS domain-containing protein [Kitasatospora sp. NPDC057223]|uniref:STAS domain-containing protein n=1 Tax=Kitasatospora sp. NPDC057223 TaxID=3346055 RepID=UPI003644E24A